MEDNKVKVPAYLSISKIITYTMYIWVIFGIIMLGLRVFLLAFSANPETTFANFVYNTSDTFLQPFRGIFPSKSVGTTGYLDVAAMFAMIIYGLIGWGFSALISYIQSKIDAFKAAANRTNQERKAAQARAAAAYATMAKKKSTSQPTRIRQ